jgi:hypothetical protein
MEINSLLRIQISNDICRYSLLPEGSIGSEGSIDETVDIAKLFEVLFLAGSNSSHQPSRTVTAPGYKVAHPKIVKRDTTISLAHFVEKKYFILH